MTNVTSIYDFSTVNITMVTNTTNAGIERVSATITNLIVKSFYITISIFGIFGNSFVLVVILSLKTMREKLTSMFIINQSVVDALTAVFLLMTTVFRSDGRVFSSLSDDLYCTLWLSRLPLWLLIHCSTFNLVALTLERYISVVHPIWHKMSFTRNKALIMIAVAWLMATIYDAGSLVPVAYVADGQCFTYTFKSLLPMRVNGILAVCLNYFIPISILIYCYSRMAYALRPKVTPNATATASGSVQASQHQNMKERARRNVVKTLLVVSSAFILCTSTNQWFFFLYNLGLFPPAVIFSNFSHMTVIAMFANCCVNPFIYATQYDEFRKAMRAIWRRLKGENTESFNSAATSTREVD